MFVETIACDKKHLKSWAWLLKRCLIFVWRIRSSIARIQRSRGPEKPLRALIYADVASVEAPSALQVQVIGMPTATA